MSKLYTYKGAVYAFDRLVSCNWEASTFAPSEKKAISNLKHRFRNAIGAVNHTPISFSGNITTS